MKKGILLTSLLVLSIVGCTNPILNNTSQYSDLDKEYSQFKTQALTQSYLKKKMDKWLSDSKYSKNLVREIEYAKFKHKDLLKDIVALQPTMFNSITGDTGVTQKRSESSFETYIQYINPFPSGVTATNATNITSSSFTANWNSVTNATGYKLYIDGTPITLGNVTSYDVTGLVDASSHSYYVKATNSAGESSVSNTINLTLPSALPIAPTANSASAITSSSFTANWTAVTGATGYKLYIDGTPITLGLVTNYNATGLTAGTSHNYYVKTINSAGDSSSSNTINLTLLSASPVATFATNITQMSYSANWTAFSGATGYKIYLDGSLTPITLANVTTYSVTGLTKGTYHTYYVQAILGSGNSPYSNTITVYTISDEFKVNTFTTNNQVYSSVAMADDGKFVVTWQSTGQDGDGSYANIYAQKYNADGTPNGSEFRVNTYTTNTQQYPAVAIANDGRFVITWESIGQDSNGNIYAQKYNADGSVNGSEFLVNIYTANNQKYSSIAMNKSTDNFVISWEGEGTGDSYGIYAQKYNADGSVNGSQFLVNSYTTSSQGNSSVTMAIDGKFIISWDGQGTGDTTGIFAKRYNSDGSSNGSQFLVNTFTTNSQVGSSVAMADDGKFVVIWKSYGQDGDIASELNIYAQKYNSDGSPNGGEFRANTYTNLNQDYPSVAMSSDGKFIISWHSYKQEGTGYNIYAQRYNSNGSTNGLEFRVNSFTNGEYSPSVSMASDGKFIAVWYGAGIGDGMGIFAKRFDSNGNVL